MSDQQKRYLFIAAFAICGIITIVLVVKLISNVIEYNKSEEEYQSIVETFVSEETPEKVVTTYAGTGTTEVISNVNPVTEDGTTYQLPKMTIDFAELTKANPDCIGWINVPGTKINYPIVQSKDNIDYVTKTFTGQENKAGCIFSDCRIVSPFTQKTILYGHNMKNGTMFHGLFEIETDKSLNDIWIFLTNGSIYHYKVTGTQRVDMLDKDVYSIATTYDDTLILSTCIEDTSRLVVIAERDWYHFGY